MKGLRKVLTPFAPDQSGAAEILYKLGGIIVIIDAGGCTGNICGFDEPRWFEQKSAVFSAGLRDMDAIMGRDDKLAAKIADAASKIEADFIALIGTPVPAVTALDYAALKRMIEKKCGLPVICADTNGMDLYDKGAEKALYAVYDEFAREKYEPEAGRINILGACPADTGSFDPEITLKSIKEASKASLNLAVSPSALKTALLLERRFKTPWKADFPQGLKILPDADYENKNILAVHQQVWADTLKKELLARGAAKVTAASWFMLSEELKSEGDVSLKEEDDFEELIKTGGFDIVIADEALKPLAKGFKGTWIDAAHFALSGRMPLL